MNNNQRRRIVAFNARKAREQLDGIRAATFIYEVVGIGPCLVDRASVDSPLVRVIELGGDNRGVEHAVSPRSIIVGRTASGRDIFLR